jgi:hypothetical protein
MAPGVMSRHGAHHYFATACGHRHRTPEAAAGCPKRGYDVETRGPRAVIEVTIRPGHITRTTVVAEAVRRHAR